MTDTLFETPGTARPGHDEPGRAALLGEGQPARPELHVVGLDLSCTRTGVATRDGVRSLTPPAQLKPSARRPSPFPRMRWIRAAVVDLTNGADLVVVEAPAYSSNQSRSKEIAGLWHVVMSVIDARGTRWIDPMSNTLKKYATGNGRCEKPEMVIAAVKRLSWLDVANDDEADAAWAMALGHDLLGQPLIELPKVNRTALDAVRARFNTGALA